MASGEVSVPWESLRAYSVSLAERLQSPQLDTHKRQGIQKEYALLASVLQKHDDVVQLEQQHADLTQQLVNLDDPEYLELVREELAHVDARLLSERDRLDRILFPPDELDTRSAFLELRPGTGGQEAALFVGDLMRMYLLYAARRGWDASIVSESSTDLGGYREVVLQIKGDDVYGNLKYESGVHRVQRVPATETAGRVHTSTASVVVLPEAKDVEVTFDPKDIRIDVYRASGAGGQHVNTTDSAVRITHIPTGIVVACQDERSQHKNKAKALKVLQARIFAAHQEKLAAEKSVHRKKIIGTGERAEKVRTYNFPQNRVSDHQADITLKSLDLFMEGHMEPIIDALRVHDEVERHKRPLPFQLSSDLS